MSEDNRKTTGAAPTAQVGLSTDLIGQTAGDVWRVLSERGSQTLTGLKKSIEAPSDTVMLAVGWLAREDKLAFDANGRSVTVSLR